MTVTIDTNNHRREIIDAWQLTASERAEFDYIDWSAIDEGRDSASFIRYKGDLIHLGDVQSTAELGMPDWAREWDGIRTDSFSSGLLFRYPREDNFETVIVARYYS